MMKKLMYLAILLPLGAVGQLSTPLSLSNMAAFKPTGNANNWQVYGSVLADLAQNEAMSTTAGTGVLVNLPNKENRANLQTAFEHGDMDVEFDFMMAKHSNSGFYLQGRYEVQLLDSWGVKSPRYGDCGGIYRRRNPKTFVEYDGHAPRLNACRAPGLWQHLFISFQAPRFDAAGNKTSNAKFLKVMLNGVLIQENVECTGPTGGPISEQEAATGPIMIQGDHGAVAFRNISYNNYDKPAPQLNNLQWALYEGAYKTTDDFLKTKPTKTGTATQISWDVSPVANNFALKYTGTLNIVTAGKYSFNFPAGGSTLVKLDGKEILKSGWSFTTDSRTADPVELSAGNHQIEYLFWKTDGWMAPALGLNLSGPGLRQTAYHASASTLVDKPAAPIFLEAKENTFLRSFVDYQGKPSKRVVHAINVGSTDDVHYSLNLDNGSLFHVWRGGFLDCSPMWDNRGDGSARALGALLPLASTPVLLRGNGVLADTLGAEAAFRFKNYTLSDKNQPTFAYSIYGANVEDEIRPDASGKYLIREVRTANYTPNTENLNVVLAAGKNIETLADGSFAIDDKRYYVKNLGEGKPIIITEGNDNAKLVVPLVGITKVKYAVMW